MNPKLPRTKAPGCPDVYIHRVANGWYVEPWSGLDHITAKVYTNARELAIDLSVRDGGRGCIFSVRRKPHDYEVGRHAYWPRTVSEALRLLKMKHEPWKPGDTESNGGSQL